MELFEEIRREHAHGAGTIRASRRNWVCIGVWCGKPWLVRFRRSANWRREQAEAGSGDGVY